jgi:branched-chain amino acid transport system permease protein
VLAVIAAVALPWLLASSYHLHIAVLTLWFAYLAMCWNLVGGYAGQPSFGHALFVGSGGYTSALLFIHFGLTPWIGMWIGGAVAALFGLFLGYISFRYRVRGHFFLLVTIAFAQFFYILVINISAIGGAAGFSIPLRGHAPWLFQFESKIYFYYIVLAMLLFVSLLSVRLTKSRLGYYWRAIKANESAAEAIGIDLTSNKMKALVLSSFLSGIGGAFYAQYMIFVEPEGLFGIGLSAEIVVFAIVGGVGSSIGPALGAVLLYPLAELLRATLGAEIPGIHLIAYGFVLIVAILFAPGGIAGLFQRAMETFGPRRAQRAAGPAS